MISALILLSLIITLGSFGTPQAAEGQAPAPFHMDGELLVKIGTPAAEDTLRAALLEASLQDLGPLEIDGWHKFAVPKGQELEWATRLVEAGLAEYAEPNYRVYIAATPDDPLWNLQWNMLQINAPAGWDITTGDQEVIIAILDTGIDLTHPDLGPKLVSGKNYINISAPPNDDHGHGSHVAGIAAAVTNNGIGVAGVNWQARLMPVKVLNAAGSGSMDDLAQGVRHAADNGARIINMSLAGWTHSQILHDALRYAALQKGCILVAAAGNCAQGGGNCPQGQINPVAYPASYDEVISVGAVTSLDVWATYSGHKDYLDISAPGGSDTNKIISTSINSGFNLLHGTSMATPHVAGLAGLIWAVNPSLNREQVWGLIRDTAAKVGADPYVAGRNDKYGYGRIDVGAALQKAGAPRLAAAPASITMLAGDNWRSPTASVRVSNNGVYSPLTWVASFTSGESWFAFTSPSSGTLGPGQSTHVRFRARGESLGEGTYYANLRIASGTPMVEGSPRDVSLILHYIPDLRIIVAPVVLSGASGAKSAGGEE